MSKKVFIFIIIFAATLSVTSCNTKKRYEAEFINVFDTLTKVIAYTENKDEFSAITQLIHDNLMEYHRLYDIYNNYEGINNIKTINDNAGIAPVEVDKKIIDLILFSKEQCEKTNGKMNIALGPVLKIWHSYRSEGVESPESARLPSMELLKAAAFYTDINQVIVDENASTIYLANSKMSLDVGSIGKGFAVRRAGETVVENGFNNVLISAGGNICAVGGKSRREKWNVGIANPDKANGRSNIHNVLLADYSLVTSGGYLRYYTVDGKQYHHIINPDTLFPSEYYSAVTVACVDSAAADALSTALFNMPFDEGLKLIDGIPDTEALWVFKNGEIKYSKNFSNLIKQ